MSQVVVAPAAVATQPAHGSLAKDALGLPAVLFCIVTGAAPLAAMMFNVPVAVSGGGIGLSLAPADMPFPRRSWWRRSRSRSSPRATSRCPSG